MRFIAIPFAVAVAVAGIGCSRDADVDYPDESYDEACREGVGDDVKNAGRVTGESVEGGVETGWAGIKQAGRATGGLVTGGTSGAEEQWERGETETEQEAGELKGEVAQANRPNCPTR